MTVYIDSLFESYKPGRMSGEWCHLWSDVSPDELDKFAAGIGLKPAWAQISRSALLGEFYHYDLRASMRQRALKHGATELELQDYLRRIQNRSEQKES